jgi:hypothetical protein
MSKHTSYVLLTASLLVQLGSAASAQQQQPQVQQEVQQLQKEVRQLQDQANDKQQQKTSVDGTSVGSFFGSAAIVNPMNMEKASIPADNFVNLPPGHNIKLPKPGQKVKKNGFVSGLGRAFAHTANFIGFPVGDDHDVDASLSSDLQNEQNAIKIHQMEASQQAPSQHNN